MVFWLPPPVIVNPFLFVGHVGVVVGSRGIMRQRQWKWWKIGDNGLKFNEEGRDTGLWEGFSHSSGLHAT